MIILKITGILLIIAGGGMFGMWQAERIRLREKSLENCRIMITTIRQGLKFTEDTPHCLLKSAAVIREVGNMDFVEGTLRGEGNFKDDWISSLNQTAIPFNKDDIKLLQGIGDILGRSDADTQLGYLSLIEESLNSVIDKSKEESQKQIKLAQTLGILFGIFLAIVLV